MSPAKWSQPYRTFQKRQMEIRNAGDAGRTEDHFENQFLRGKPKNLLK